MSWVALFAYGDVLGVNLLIENAHKLSQPGCYGSCYEKGNIKIRRNEEYGVWEYCIECACAFVEFFDGCFCGVALSEVEGVWFAVGPCPTLCCGGVR